MSGAFRAELLKLTQRPAFWILLAVLVGGVLLFGYILLWALATQAPSDALEGGFDAPALLGQLRPERIPTQVLSMVTGFGGTLALILGALSVGSEFGWRTLGTIATQRPGRLALVLGRYGALFTACLVLAAAAFVGGAAGSALVAVLEPIGAELPAAADVAAAFGASVLVLVLWCMLGACLAMLFEGTGWAIGLGLLWALAVESLVGLVPLPGRAGELLQEALISSNSAALLAAVSPQGAETITDPSLDIAAGQAVTVLVAYLVVALVVATAVFLRRDIA